MRIVFIDHTARLGGGEIALLNLIAQLDRRVFEPIVIVLAPGPLQDRLATIGCAVRVIPLDPGVGDARKDSLGIGAALRLGSVAALADCLRRLAATIAELEPSLVHTNSLKADILGGVAAKRAGVPVLWHVRDRIADDYLPPAVARTFRHMCRWIPDGLIANSFATLRTLGPARHKTWVVHDGTLVPPLPAPAAARNGEPVVGLVGRLAPWKGQHIFIQAAATLAAQFPTARFRLIGAALFGEEAYEASLRQQVQQLHLEHAIEFAGFRDDVQSEIAQLDIVVHASTTAEPFGQVVIEGMAAAKPMIATAGGGVLEIVVDGVTGMLVPMSDARALAAAIGTLLSDPARRQAMGIAGRERVLRHFTIQHVARNVERIYRQMLGM